MTLPGQNPNAILLLAIVEKLVPLLDRLAFVGGCATGLLITDPAAAPVRPTLDVDAIIEVASYGELVVLEEQLGQLGFHHAQCMECADLSLAAEGLDSRPDAHGSSNFGVRKSVVWSGVEGCQSDGDRHPRHPTDSGSMFPATKLDAFHGRGHQDYRISHDIEDMLTVVDGRAEIVGEVRQSEAELRECLREEFFTLLGDRDFMESLPGHLLPDAASQQRAPLVAGRMRQIAGGG